MTDLENNEFKGGFESLDVWIESRKYRKSISELIRKFPKDEKFKLVDQLHRSARSISANVAEGYGKYHYQENIQSCRNARGSLMETMDHLICANDEGYIDSEQLKEFRIQYELILRLINGYISYLKKRKQES